MFGIRCFVPYYFQSCFSFDAINGYLENRIRLLCSVFVGIVYERKSSKIHRVKKSTQKSQFGIGRDKIGMPLFVSKTLK